MEKNKRWHKELLAKGDYLRPHSFCFRTVFERKKSWKTFIIVKITETLKANCLEKADGHVEMLPKHI